MAVFFLLICMAGAGRGDVDAVSGASRPLTAGGRWLPTVMLPAVGRELAELIGSDEALCLLATSGFDNGPYTERISARLNDVDQVLRFALRPGALRDSIERSGRAMLSVYGVSEGSDGNRVGQGARLVLECLGGGLQEQQSGKGLRIMVMRVVAVLPP